MRLLITGGCGFLGSHLVEHFIRNTDGDTDIVVLDKMTYASNGFDRLRDVAGGLAYGLPERVQVLGCDLAQPVPEGVLREIGRVDFVIHAAAESHVDNSIADPLPFLQSNVIGTHNLLMAIRRMESVQRTFVVSTDEVYGPAPLDQRNAGERCCDCKRQLDAAPFDEDAAFRPANPYAASKAGAEAVAMAYANTYNLPITIVNTMNLYGERQHPEKFIPMVIRKVRSGEIVKIHADSTRTRSGSRFYLHCRTFAHALSWLITYATPMVVTSVTGPGQDHGFAVGDEDVRRALPLKIHVCGEREISNLTLAHMIAGYVGGTLRYELVDFHSSRPGHDLRYAMCDDLIQDMGWIRPMNLEQSLEKTVRWYLDHPRWLDR